MAEVAKPMRILVVEDDDASAATLGAILLARHETERVATLAQALERLRARSFDAIVTDLGLPDSDGLETLRAVVKAAPRTAIVVLTGADAPDAGIAALAEGAQDFLVKGSAPPELILRTLRHASVRKRLEDEQRQRMVTRKLVRRLFQRLGENGMLLGPIRRELGRSLAAEVEGATAEDFVHAFHNMGLGEISLARRDAGRLSFHGRQLIEATPERARANCQLALGFLEGAVESLLAQPALGSEIRCQSQGHPECVFEVMGRPPPPAPPSPRRRATHE